MISTTNASPERLVVLLSEYLINTPGLSGQARHAPPAVTVEIGNPALNDFVFHELGELLATDPRLSEAIDAARCDEDEATDSERTTRLRSVQSRLRHALGGRPDLVEALSVVLPRHPVPGAEQCRALRGRSSRFSDLRGVVTRSAAAGLLIAIIASVVAATVWLDGKEVGQLTVIELFATAVLAFLPGWLFVRFLAFRAGALWNEYVLNLHRLEMDRPQHLPRPPENSAYYESWWSEGGWIRERAPTIYQQKFDAYYGKRISQATSRHEPTVRCETLFPVLLMTAVVAAGWVAVFRAGTLLSGAEPTRLMDMLAFAFVGAYVFNLQTFVRRYFQGDLKASAYAGGLVRIITALVLVAVLYWLPQPDLQGRSGAVAAFVVGIFPLVGMQVLTRAASVLLRAVVPTLRSDYPLSDLDGLNIWYETRMLEEGIEDMQNLTTMNLVDVILHTRVPVGRLVDWVDQAYLYVNLSRAPRVMERRRAARNARRVIETMYKGGDPVKKHRAVMESVEPTHPREQLRRCGIRNATAFVTVFRPLIDGDDEHSTSHVTAKAAERWLVSQDKAWRGALRPLTRVLMNEAALRPVWSWRQCHEDGLPSRSTRPVSPLDERRAS